MKAYTIITRRRQSVQVIVNLWEIVKTRKLWISILRKRKILHVKKRKGKKTTSRVISTKTKIMITFVLKNVHMVSRAVKFNCSFEYLCIFYTRILYISALQSYNSSFTRVVSVVGIYFVSIPNRVLNLYLFIILTSNTL